MSKTSTGATEKGQGIWDNSMGTKDIFGTVEALTQRQVEFMPPPESYYDGIDQRLPDHGEDVERMRKNSILIDGAPGGGTLLQIFSKTVIGPIFFEIIQREGDEGFGEGNFQALFEAMEQDQIDRGVN